MSGNKQPDPLYDRLMNFEIGIDEFIELRNKERQQQKERNTMRIRSQESIDLVNAARKSTGRTDLIPSEPEGLTPEYIASLEAEDTANANMVPENVIDAHFNELNEANARNADDERPPVDHFAEPQEKPQTRFDKFWYGEGAPRPDATEVGIFALVAIELRDIGQQIGGDIKKLNNGVSNVWIATCAQLDTWNKSATLWAKAEVETLNKRWVEYRKRRKANAEIFKQDRAYNRPVTKLVFEELADHILQTQEKLRNEFVGRITALEKTVATQVAPAPKPNYSDLDKLLRQMADGKVIAAMKTYREMTGCTLAEAKGKFEALVAA